MKPYKLNPIVLFGLALVGISLLYFSTGSVTKVSDKLNDSLVFRRIIKCTDIVDGAECFKENKSALIRELKMKTSIGQQQWENCLNIIGDNSDINILLNIQKCYHQSDLLDKHNRGDTKFSVLAITGSLIIQVFIAFHLVLSYAIKNNEVDEGRAQVNRLESGVKGLKVELQELENQHKDLVILHNSDIKNILGRLGKGGDIRRELEFLKRCFMQLNNDFNQFKIEYFAKNNNDFLILPPTNSLASPFDSLNSPFSSNPPSKLNIPNHNYKKNDLFSTPQFQQLSQIDSISNNTPVKIDNKSDSCNKENDNNSPKGFDILSSKGRDELKRYVQTRLRYKDLVKESNGKVLKRIFLPGRGWISAKKLEEEENQYGSDGFIIGL